LCCEGVLGWFWLWERGGGGGGGLGVSHPLSLNFQGQLSLHLSKKTVIFS